MKFKLKNFFKQTVTSKKSENTKQFSALGTNAVDKIKRDDHRNFLYVHRVYLSFLHFLRLSSIQHVHWFCLLDFVHLQFVIGLSRKAGI